MASMNSTCARIMVGNISFVVKPRVKPRSICTPQVRACAKLSKQQLRERIQLQSRESPHGTPVVDWLLETSPYSPLLQPVAIEDLRERERKIAHIEDIGEKLRRLRIAIANKNRQPWNAGKKHSPETIKKIRDSVHKMVHTASAVEDRKRRTEAWQREAPDKVIESKAKAAESLRARWGLQIHRQHGFKNARICQAQSWRTDKWSRMPKKKKKKSPPRRRRRHSSQMTEQELEERRERTRLRKSQAQKRLWQDPEYRQRQLQSMRSESSGTPSRRRRTVGQLQRALQRNKQQLSQAEQLVPQLETVVEKLQLEAGAEGSTLNMQHSIQAALKSSLRTLDKGRTTLAALKNEHTSLQAALEQTKRAAQDAPTQHGTAANTDSSSGVLPADRNAASTPPASPDAAAAGSLVQQDQVAWPTAEQVQGSGAAWKRDTEGDSEALSSSPHEQPDPEFPDGRVFSPQHSVNGDPPSLQAWLDSAGMSSWSPRSPGLVNVRNGAGRTAVPDESGYASDPNLNPHTQTDSAAGGSVPGHQGDFVGAFLQSGILGSGKGGQHAVAKEVSQNDPSGSGHESDAESRGPPPHDSNSEQLNSGSPVDANGSRQDGVYGYVNGIVSSSSAEQGRLQQLDTGANGHVLHKSSTAAEEGKPAASENAKLNAGASKDLPAADSQSATLDAGSDDDEESSWLSRRKHRLPWQ